MAVAVQRCSRNDALAQIYANWVSLYRLNMPFLAITETGRRLTVHCMGTATLADMRRAIQAASGIPTEMQILMANGSRLREDTALLVRDYGLLPGDKILVLHRRV